MPLPDVSMPVPVTRVSTAPSASRRVTTFVSFTVKGMGAVLATRYLPFSVSK